MVATFFTLSFIRGRIALSLLLVPFAAQALSPGPFLGARNPLNFSKPLGWPFESTEKSNPHSESASFGTSLETFSKIAFHAITIA